MRLSSTAFTHTSTALFGLAVAGYAAVRLAGYDVPPLPGHLALPDTPILQLVPDSGHSDKRSAKPNAGLADPPTPRPDSARNLQTNAAAETSMTARPTDTPGTR